MHLLADNVRDESARRVLENERWVLAVTEVRCSTAFASWAHQLEITRGELDEMSPTIFGKAWDKRNECLRDGGVFEYVTELSDAHGWDVIQKMTASELIRAVADLGLTPSAANSEPADARR